MVVLWQVDVPNLPIALKFVTQLVRPAFHAGCCNGQEDPAAAVHQHIQYYMQHKWSVSMLPDGMREVADQHRHPAISITPPAHRALLHSIMTYHKGRTNAAVNGWTCLVYCYYCLFSLIVLEQQINVDKCVTTQQL